MIGLIQRVKSASVTVNDEVVGEIGKGILLLVGVEKPDDEAVCKKLVDRVTNYRIFEDDTGRMNHSLLDIEGELLVVPQFTLAANTKKGMRPSFTSAAPPDQGNELYKLFVTEARKCVNNLQTGVFGADMQVALVNDGPVTFNLTVSNSSELTK